MKKFHKHSYSLTISALLAPVSIFAFSLKDSTFKITLGYITDTVNLAIPVLSGLAFLFFFWGLSKFILNADKQTEIENGKNYMMWGILALFILLSFRTIIGLISKELEIGDSKNYPLIPYVQSGQVEVGPNSTGFTR